MRSRLVRSIVLALMLIAPQLGLAQQAPTGMHYGGRATDTGYGGSLVNPTGVYSTSIPLALPAERAGLPVPLQISYGTHGVGAAGLGWDIPFSYIRRDRTFAHRRPAYRGYELPQPREHAFLSLLGAGGELVRNGDEWIVRTGTLELAVRESGDMFLAYDGAGRTYRFTQPQEFGSAGLWLLKSVSTTGGASVELTYQITKRPIDGGTGLEVNLTRIVYNTSPVAGCAKHEIVLTYGNSSTSPLSISMLGEKALARFRVLRWVDVMSRSTCADQPERLRSYELQYPTPDPDTKLPRLGSVRMFGRQGTPEAAIPLPVASYEYGSATFNGKLKYEITQTVHIPPDAEHNLISATVLDSSVAAPVPGEHYAMWQSLTDVTGDGRPDLVFKKNDKLQIAFNNPASDGNTVLGQVVVPLNDSTLTTGPFSTHTTAERRLWYGSANRNTMNVWRQAIDVNGDGRLDIIDAGAEPERWIVYLNMPDGPTGIKWLRRSLSVRNLAILLTQRGHVIDHGYVPLARRTTGVGVRSTMCLLKQDGVWVPHSGPMTIESDGMVATFACLNGHPQTAPPPPPTFPPSDEGEKTFTEWELTDLNGDGYPDFVFNSDPAQFRLAPAAEISSSQTYWIGPTDIFFQLSSAYFSTNEIYVAYNIVGTRFDSIEHNPFARPIALNSPGADRGVGLWANAEADKTQTQEAGFADVNGDGLLDRVVGRTAYFGVFTGTAHSFFGIHLTLPGFLSQQRSGQDMHCQTASIFTSRLAQGLRDLTGDGIPDHFDNGRVSIGTGAGFAPPISIESPVDFQFSHQTEGCNGRFSNTDGGLFDIDGDGKPDIIGIVMVNNHWAYLISQLATGTTVRAPEAGRLTVVDNGYGAKTRIGYRSAKEDLHSSHQVPFPEIVATSIETIGAHGLGGSLAGTRYAYGRAQMIFDSAHDAFLFPGYGRTVELRLYTGLKDKFEGAARVVDYWPLTPFSLALTKEQRWLRIQRAGRVQDSYTLRGSGTVDPWALLNISGNDTRIIGDTHWEWGARLFETTLGTNWNLRDCLEMVDPYDLANSFGGALGSNGLISCSAHGFAFAASAESWYGGSPPPSVNNVQARSRVLRVDDFGRVLSARYDNDVFRSDDDVCTETEFATPTQPYPRVLSALAARRALDCANRGIFASESWSYDGLPSGSVSDGRLTSHTVDRRATDNGAPLGSVRLVDATYDLAGNLASLSTERPGAKRTVTFDYDLFGLVPVSAHVDATGLPSTTSSASYDPLTLEQIDLVNINGIHTGAEFDGYGRALRTTLSAPGGLAGVLSAITYQGFAEGESGGLRVTVKSFSDPVPPATAAGAAGRTATTFLDELGRERLTELPLGQDYGGETLVLNARIYDSAGRVAFQADPYRLSQASASLYGTSYHFKNTGDLDCVIRGWGRQPLNKITDTTAERLPTCFNRVITDHVAILDVQDAASLEPGSPQAGVLRRTVSSAIGQVLERSTIRAGLRLDHATFSYDRLGQSRSVTRYLDPVGPTNPVTWLWRLDSIGQTIQLDEPQSAPRRFLYSDWGELVETQWMDSQTNRQLVRSYDALGRLTSSEERNDGLADPETQNVYLYDTGISASPLVAPEYVLGRLAGARYPRGEVAFGYDAFGLVNARVFHGGQAGPFVEKREHHADGRLAMLQFNLPDQNYAPEAAKYGYDSAGRLKSVRYGDASGGINLYQAEDIDPLGRVRVSRHGSAISYHADFADIGRRLMREAIIDTPQGSRAMFFHRTDPLGRELSRLEIKDAASNGVDTSISYDALGRLATAVRTEGPVTLSSWTFGYDPLGNLLRLEDTIGAADAYLSYGAPDRDRLCRIDYGNGGPVTGPCNVLHDVSGNMVSEPTRMGTRQFGYFSSGAIRTIGSQGAQADFSYDAFGRVSELNLTGAALDNRRDRHYGEFIEQREVEESGATVTRIIRHIPGAQGILATKRGASTNWVFEFGELRGGRFFVDQAGHLIQDTEYQPFGEATSAGAPAGTSDYTSYQWNAGDAFAAFGLSHLGARIYDPVIGRFISRDPLLVAETANTGNPYAFALNDPFNAADPSGRQPCFGQECWGLNNSGLIPLPLGWPGGSGPAPLPPQPQAPNIQMIVLPWGASVDPKTGGITVSPAHFAPLGIVPGVFPEGLGFMDPLYWIEQVNPLNLSTIGQPSPFRLKDSGDILLEAEADMEETAKAIWGTALTVSEGAAIVIQVAQEIMAIRLAERAARMGLALRAGAGGAIMSGGSTARASIPGWTMTRNAAGGRLYATEGLINEEGVNLLVEEIASRAPANARINLLTGVHGGEGAITVTEQEFYLNALVRINDPRVRILNFNMMPRGEITNILRGSDITIGGFCYSGTCLAPYTLYYP